jgi:hypothetical protein
VVICGTQNYKEKENCNIQKSKKYRAHQFYITKECNSQLKKERRNKGLYVMTKRLLVQLFNKVM